jgi:hypothetical protein
MTAIAYTVESFMFPFAGHLMDTHGRKVDLELLAV